MLNQIDIESLSIEEKKELLGDLAAQMAADDIAEAILDNLNEMDASALAATLSSAVED